ncbi:conserved hypothetical protein [Hyphomicrobiales bacterium]|nr:conserved hypothetical protein [Hyphomicrobiales bacterium]CAH1669291.1 conserved hypothetical protein [Hyphomicrobiales bacterium]
MQILVSTDGVIQQFADAIQPARMQRAMREGLQEGGKKTLTQVRRALRTQTGVKAYRAILERTHGSMAGDLAYVIRGEGKGMPIGNFRVGVNSKGVLAFPWGTAHQFKRSFAVGGRYRARTTSARFPIRALYGPSVAKEIVKDQSEQTFEQSARTFVLDAITRRVMRAMP